MILNIHGCPFCKAVSGAPAQCKDIVFVLSGGDEVFIGGGAQVYAEALQANLVDRMYLTIVHAEVEADTFFPEYALAEWTIVEEEYLAANESNPHPMTFQVLHRSDSPASS